MVWTLPGGLGEATVFEICFLRSQALCPSLPAAAHSEGHGGVHFGAALWGPSSLLCGRLALPLLLLGNPLCWGSVEPLRAVPHAGALLGWKNLSGQPWASAAPCLASAREGNSAAPGSSLAQKSPWRRSWTSAGSALSQNRAWPCSAKVLVAWWTATKRHRFIARWCRAVSCHRIQSKSKSFMVIFRRILLS